MRKLVLFDIDGTLLSTNGAAGRAFEAALVDVYGTAGAMGRVSFAGKTDPQIAHELLAGVGLSATDIDRHMDELWQRYLLHLDEALVDAALRVYPGVVACLEMVEEGADEAAIGLLTGNIEGGARRKLDAAGIGFRRFRVGSFGSDSADRNDLPAIAAERARQHLGVAYGGADLVVIGDTPADVACGAAFGARTIAVATGSYPREQLAACRPDHLFDTLEDGAAVWQAITG